MTVDLFPIRGRNRYCGPAAIAALTGLTTDESAFFLRLATGRTRIMLTRPPEIIEVLSWLDVSVKAFHRFDQLRDGPDLRGWLIGFPSPWIRVYLIATVRHWQVVSGEMLACSMHRTPTSWRDMRKHHLQRRVRAVWAVSHRSPKAEPQPQPVFMGSDA